MTKILCYNQHHSRIIRSLKNTTIKVTQDFTYEKKQHCVNKKRHRHQIGESKVCSKQTGCDVWESSLPANLKRNCFSGYCGISPCVWTLKKSLEKTTDDAFTRMLRVVLNISSKQHPTKNEFYGIVIPVISLIKDRILRFAGHCFRSKEELTSDLILQQSLHVLRTPDIPSKTFIEKLAEDMDCKTGRSEELDECQKSLEGKSHDMLSSLDWVKQQIIAREITCKV